MKRLWVTEVPIVLLLVSNALLAQQSDPVRICVVGRDFRNPNPVTHALNSTPNIRYQRDAIAKYLNQHKSGASSPITIEAVVLKSANMATVNGDADKAGCKYLVTVWTVPVPKDDADPRNNRSGSDFVLGSDGFPPPNPLNFSIQYRLSPDCWNSLPYGSYSSSKWYAKDIADEVYATILKNPAP